MSQGEGSRMPEIRDGQQVARDDSPPFALGVTSDLTTSEGHRCPSCGKCYPLSGTCWGFGPDEHAPVHTESVNG